MALGCVRAELEHERLAAAGVTLHIRPGTAVSRNSMACAWGCAASTADVVSLIFAMTTPRKAPFPKSFIGASIEGSRSGFGMHWHMLNATN